MIIAFDDDATVYPPSLSFFGATTWTWAFSEALRVGRVIEAIVYFNKRSADVLFYKRNADAIFHKRHANVRFID